MDMRMFSEALMMSQKPDKDEIADLLEKDGHNKNHVDRTLTFRMNKDNVDRYGSVLALNGWKLDNYRENPVFLYQHNNACFSDSLQMPVGRSLKEWTVLPEYRSDKAYLRKNPVDNTVDDGTGLYQLVYFPDNKNSEAVLEAYNRKLLSTVSVGFNPIDKLDINKIEKDDLPLLGNPTRFVSVKTELLECSAVTVPGNTQAKAVRTAMSNGYPDEFLNILGITEIGERFGDIRAAVEAVQQSMEAIVLLDKRLSGIEERLTKDHNELRNELRDSSKQVLSVINTKLMSLPDKSTISDEFIKKLDAIKEKLN